MLQTVQSSDVSCNGFNCFRRNIASILKAFRIWRIVNFCNAPSSIRPINAPGSVVLASRVACAFTTASAPHLPSTHQFEQLVFDAMFLDFLVFGSSNSSVMFAYILLPTATSLTECKVFEAFIKNCFNLSLRMTFLQSCYDATFSLDSLELSPNFFRIIQAANVSTYQEPPTGSTG